jgi:broad specificity phosphatase PhoE
LTAHLLLLCHAASASARTAGFPGDDEPLDPAAAAALDGLRLRPSDRQFVSPLARARETATRLALAAAVEPALIDCDFGRWRGDTLQAAQAREPQAVAKWLHEPASRPHGGESVVALIARVAAWMEQVAPTRGVTLAITHAAVIRAGVVAALGADARAFWRIDAAPLTLARLSGHSGRWNLVSLGAWRGDLD